MYGKKQAVCFGRQGLPDDPPTGPRESEADVQKFNAARSLAEQVVARTIYTSGFTWAGLIFWDDIRTLDYLASRPEVDDRSVRAQTTSGSLPFQVLPRDRR